MTLKMTKPVKTKQDFLEDCSKWCEGFQNANKVMIAYVRRGKRPKQTILVQTEEGTIKIARQGKRKPQGVVAAYRGNDGVLRIGWSLCRKSEPFNSKVGLRYALERSIPVDDLKSQHEVNEVDNYLQSTTDSRAIATNKAKLALYKSQCPPQSVRKTLNAILERVEKL